MRLHHLELGRGQLAGLAQDGVFDTDLADIVQGRADADQLYVLNRQVELLAEEEGEEGNARECSPV